MKSFTAFVLGLVFCGAGQVSADIYLLDISPLAGSALNNVNYANGDHALGLSALNAVGQPASAATGDEIAGGIFYDDVSNELTYNVGYGSDFGFVDLAGDWSNAHIHGPANVQFPAPNTGAGVVTGLSHTPGSSPRTGSFAGTATLSDPQEAQLLNNQYYINIHSGFAGGGEIRGQLVPISVAVPEPSTLGLFAAALVIIRIRRAKLA